MKSRIDGWRYWWLPPGDDRLVSPYGQPGAQLQCWPRWDGPHYVAVCDKHPDPPAAGCECGAYASPNLPDVLCQARLIRDVWAARWRAERGRSMPTLYLVVGRVALTEPVVHQPDPEDPEVWELRARAATITELWIEHDARHMLRKRLAARYGVPVLAGSPAYSEEDWRSRTRSARYDWAKAGLKPPTKLDKENEND